MAAARRLGFQDPPTWRGRLPTRADLSLLARYPPSVGGAESPVGPWMVCPTASSWYTVLAVKYLQQAEIHAQCGANIETICKEQLLNLTTGDKDIIRCSSGAVPLQVECEEQHAHVERAPEKFKAQAGMLRSVEYETRRDYPYSNESESSSELSSRSSRGSSRRATTSRGRRGEGA